jgi:nitrite reductase (NADH) large subunit
MDPVVVVGNGVAAVSAVESFRRIDNTTPIVVVGEEPYHAYYRIRLTQGMGEIPDENKLLIHPPKWYRDKGVEVMLNRQAVSVEVENRRVILTDGRLSYSKLLLAQGSKPFVPPVLGSDLPGVFSIRTLDDVKGLHSFSQGKERGTVVGGGVLGLEVAWALAQKGQKISVIEGSSHILSRQLDETASGLLTSLGQRAGIEFVVSDKLNRVQGHGKVHSILLDRHQEIPTDYVVFSTGVRPNIRIVQGTPIKIDKGIQVNEFMQSSVEDVYSAGDVAEFRGQVHGLWSVAKEQGKCAGLNMAGDETPYNEIPPSNYIKVFGVDIFSVGDLCKDGSAQAVMTNYEPEQYRYSAVFFKEEGPVGAILFGDTRAAVPVSRAIKSGQKFSRDLITQGNFVSFLENIG